MDKPVIILVHGVGDGVFYDAWASAYPHLLQIGFQVADIEEFEWNAVVEQTGKRETRTFVYLTIGTFSIHLCKHRFLYSSRARFAFPWGVRQDSQLGFPIPLFHSADPLPF